MKRNAREILWPKVRLVCRIIGLLHTWRYVLCAKGNNHATAAASLAFHLKEELGADEQMGSLVKKHKAEE